MFVYIVCNRGLGDDKRPITEQIFIGENVAWGRSDLNLCFIHVLDSAVIPPACEGPCCSSRCDGDWPLQAI